MAVCATWGMPPEGARRLRRLVQSPPACPGEPLGRVGWTMVGRGGSLDSGWQGLDRLVEQLAAKQNLAVWPCAWKDGTGVCFLRFRDDPGLDAGLEKAISDLVGLAVGNVLLHERMTSRQGDYLRIFQNSRDMIYLSTRDGSWVDVNQAGVEMLGYDSAEQLLAVPDSAQAAYLNPADRHRFMASIEKDGFVKDYEVTFRRKDGTPIEVSITAQVRQRGGKVSGYEGIIKDITERKRAQRQADRQHQMVAAILEAMPVAVFVVDQDHRVQHWNRACEELTGWKRQDIMGTDRVWQVFNRPKGVSLADLVLDGDLTRLQQVYGRESLRRSTLSGDAWEAEAYFEELGGRPKELFFTAAALRDENQVVFGAVEAILETTDLKELQRQLAESENLYRTLVEANREGICLHDYQRFIFANQAFSDMFGMTRDVGAWRGDFLELLAPGCRRSYLEWMRALEQGLPTDPVFEGQGMRQGEPFDLELTAAPTTYRGSTAVLFTSRDVTVRKRMEEQLVRSERLAATGKLAFDIAHEVNNPLGGILTYAHLLSEDLGEENPLHVTVDKIIKLTNRCKIIVRGLLDFARQEAPRKEPLDLNRVLKEMLSLMDGHVILRDVDLVQDLDPHLPAFYGQRSKLEQVLLNMVINAAEAMEGHGRMVMRTSWSAESRQICIQISDTGPGMDEDVARRIFEPFFTTKERGRGTGLGLAISHGIIKQHEGRIEVTSRPGEGTTFTIYLPIKDENPGNAWAAS